MSTAPELVFINCCHLGKIPENVERTPYTSLAASLAEQLIRNGVRCVVPAGWAVDDGAAKTFAHKFYDSMLEGVPFGEAVRLARGETYQRHVKLTFAHGAALRVAVPVLLALIVGGVILLILAIGNGFVGYSLPDDLVSGTGIRIAFSITESVLGSDENAALKPAH